MYFLTCLSSGFDSCLHEKIINCELIKSRSGLTNAERIRFVGASSERRYGVVYDTGFEGRLHIFPLHLLKFRLFFLPLQHLLLTRLLWGRVGPGAPRHIFVVFFVFIKSILVAVGQTPSSVQFGVALCTTTGLVLQTRL